MKNLEKMSGRSLSPLIPLALGIFALTICASPASGQGFRFQNFSSTNNLSLNGTPTGLLPMSTGGALRLTDTGGGEAGSAWFTTAESVSGGFTTIFTFQITPTGVPFTVPADGIAFVIQNDTRGLRALGGGGGSIGYGTNPDADTVTTDAISNSLAVEIDTYKNPTDPDANHIAVQSCGTGPNSSDETAQYMVGINMLNCNLGIANATALSGVGLGNLADGSPHTVEIDYQPSASCGEGGIGTLNVHVLNTTVFPTTVDPLTLAPLLSVCNVNLANLLNLGAGGTAFVGFTASTGGSVEDNDILNWEFVTPITLPLNGNAATNTFTFPFAQYNVVYPSRVSIPLNTTMTISPAVLSQSACNWDVNRFGTVNAPTCTTFINLYNLSAIFDVTCFPQDPVTHNCPPTGGFDPFQGVPHNGQDIINTLVYLTMDPTPSAPQMLTAPEGTNSWVPFGLAFQTDCCTRGSGTSSYNSLVVSVDFPPGNPTYTIPAYKFVGFDPPVDNAGPGKINEARAGSVIPFKWRLLYPVAPTLGFNGGPVTNLTFFPVGTLAITEMLRSGGPSVIIDDQSNVGLVNQGNGRYLFPWKTTKSLAGKTIRVTLSTGDGVNHNADFKFEKDR